MSRTSFTALLKKYQAGEATESERQVVERWYALIDEEPRILSDSEWDALEKRLWLKLHHQSSGSPGPPAPLHTRLARRPLLQAGIAAAAAVLLAVAFLLTRPESMHSSSVQDKGTGMRTVKNPGEKELIIRLEDGSTVHLSQSGELQYPLHFEGPNREVSLRGEAFFEVSENSNRPFLVNTGQITTKVLGTSFRIKAPQANSEVEVSVKTGKVSVYEKARTDPEHSSKNSNGVILNPNQQVTFNPENRIFITRLVDNPVMLPHTNTSQPGKFNYNDTPLSEILSELRDAYSIELELEKKALGECPLTANLSQKDLYIQLDLICAAIQGKYEIKGTAILISGKGCEQIL